MTFCDPQVAIAPGVGIFQPTWQAKGVSVDLKLMTREQGEEC